MRVRGRSDDGQLVMSTSGERISQSELDFCGRETCLWHIWMSKIKECNKFIRSTFREDYIWSYKLRAKMLVRTSEVVAVGHHMWVSILLTIVNYHSIISTHWHWLLCSGFTAGSIKMCHTTLRCQSRWAKFCPVMMTPHALILSGGSPEPLPGLWGSPLWVCRHGAPCAE